jgi:hypothetical protein
VLRYAPHCVREKYQPSLVPALSRDRSKLRAWNDPGSAVRRYALHCVREK